MERTTLGRTSIEITRLCIGCWQAAGWMSSDDDRFVATVRHALDAGLTFLDTAAGYGDGHSEELVARAIAGRRDGVVLATKFAHTDSRPAAVRQSLEASLRRLRTDYVDLFQQHWPPPDIPLAETLGALERLKEEGKIRAIGVSNWMEPEWAELADPARVDSVQPCYSLLWRSIEPHVLPLCRAHDIAVLPYSPLCQGVLAGRFADAADIPRDMRQANHQLQPGMFPRVREVVQAVEDVGRTYGKTAGQTALRWLLDQEGVTAPIVGASRPEQVDENLGALDWRLDRTDWQRLDRTDWQRLADLSWPLSAELGPHDTLWDSHPREA